MPLIPVSHGALNVTPDDRAESLRVLLLADVLGRLDKAAGRMARGSNPEELAFVAKFGALQNALFGRVMDRTPAALVAACEAFDADDIAALRRRGFHEASDDLDRLGR